MTTTTIKPQIAADDTRATQRLASLKKGCAPRSRIRRLKDRITELNAELQWLRSERDDALEQLSEDECSSCDQGAIWGRDAQGRLSVMSECEACGGTNSVGRERDHYKTLAVKLGGRRERWRRRSHQGALTVSQLLAQLVTHLDPAGEVVRIELVG